MKTVDDLTPVWLTQVLRDSGVLPRDVAVAQVDTTPVGTGQMGDSTRISVRYDGDTAAPASLVAKLPAANETSRNTAVMLRTYEVEVRFYQQLAPHLPIRTPHCYHASVEPGTPNFVLLLEDLAPAEQGDQVTGCTVEQAEVAVLELAKLHAPRWGDSELDTLDWLNRDAGDMLLDLVPRMFPGFQQRYDGRIDADILAMGKRFVDKLETYYGLRPTPWTIVHNDYRLDNQLFATDAGGYPIAVVDWQTVGHGPAMGDVSYFLGAGVLPDVRRVHEEGWVRAYYDALCAAGVADYTWDACWEQYRMYTFAGLHMAILASMVVEQTDRGDEMFIAMAQRHGRHVLDLDAEAFLG